MKQSVAWGKMKLAIDRMVNDFPLHAGILAQWRVVEDPSVNTMGVGFRDGKLQLVFALDFVNSITLDELGAVLHHEVNHVLFDHVLHIPPPGENKTARTIAQEVTVNEWVAGKLPGNCVLLEGYPDLPANEDTDTRYGRLRKRIRDGASGAGMKAAPNHQQGGIPTPDNHDTWGQIAGNAAQAKAASRMDIAMAWGNLTDEQKAKIAEPFQEIADSASQEVGLGDSSGAGIGNEAGTGRSAIQGGTARVPWQSALRRRVGRVFECRPRFGRPPRRFPGMVGIIPGKGRYAAKPNVMTVIDTSGSMSNKMLSDISAELMVMARHYKVTVVECDTEIHAVYPYRPINGVSGRGGTDFHPPLAPEFLRVQKPDLIVYFTDGQGPAPATSPKVPVIWCITEGGSKPTVWGDEILLAESHFRGIPTP